MNSGDLPEIVTVYTATPNGRGGKTFSSPVQVRGRWEQRQERVRDVKGDEYVGKHSIFLSADVAVGDYLVRGAQDGADPIVLGGVEVKFFSKISDLNGVEFTRKAVV